MSKAAEKKSIPVAGLFLLVLASALAPLLGWVTNLLKAEDLPAPLRDNPLRAWLLLVALTAVVAIAYQRVTSRRTDDSRSVQVTPVLRSRLLSMLKVRIDGRIADALQYHVRLRLDLQEVPDAVLVPGLRAMGDGSTAEPLSSTQIESAFDSSAGRLLILGEPGAGKTTLLLELAAVLIRRAEADETARVPVPVIVNVSSWAERKQSIAEWLVPALKDFAGINDPALARALLRDNHLLVLFDGLDEVPEEQRAACLDAINLYLGERMEQAVACCRTKEYEAARTKLHLLRAVRIEPLDPDRVRFALRGDRTQALRALLASDESMRALVTTPLMLSVALLSYADVPPASDLTDTVGGPLQGRLWNDYIVSMLRRCGELHAGWAVQRFLAWLSWLACRMRRDDMTDFVLERMRPRWLTYRLAYQLTCMILFAIYGAVLGCPSPSWKWTAFVSGCFCILGLWESREIRGNEGIRWSWRLAITGLPGSVLIVASVTFLWFVWHPGFGRYGFRHIFGLLALQVCLDGYAQYELDSPMPPGARLRAQLWNASFPALVFAVMCSGIFAVSSFVLGDSVSEMVVIGIMTLAIAFTASLGFFGGNQVVKHYLVRVALVIEGAGPWRYAEFLQMAAKSLFLQQDGDVTRFRHLLLRDHLANLSQTELRTLEARIQGSATDPL